MPDSKISNLPAASTVSDEDLVPLVQGGTNKKAALSVIRAAMGDAYYHHIQSVPSVLWTINHNLGKHPAITARDSTGRECHGTTIHLNNNITTLGWGAPFSGDADCN